MDKYPHVRFYLTTNFPQSKYLWGLYFALDTKFGRVDKFSAHSMDISTTKNKAQLRLRFILLNRSIVSLNGSIIKTRIDVVDVFAVQSFFCQTQSFAKSLEVDDLSFPQEFDDIVHIRII